MSRGSRFVAFDWNATQCGLRPFVPSTDGLELSPFAWAPSLATLTRSMAPPMPERWRTKTSSAPFESRPTRLVAALVKAYSDAVRPSWLNAPPVLGPLALRLMRAVTRVPLTSACETAAAAALHAQAAAAAIAKNFRVLLLRAAPPAVHGCTDHPFFLTPTG